MNVIASEVALARGYLGPELFLMCIAFLVGGAARLGKRLVPASVVPAASAALGAALMGAIALLLGEAVPPALVLGAAAGGMAIGGHELAKKLLERVAGTALAEEVLGVSADKLAPAEVAK